MSNGATNGLPLIDVTLTVQHFRDAINGPFDGGSLTAHDIQPQNLPNVYHRTIMPLLKNVIRVDYPGAILHFKVVGADGGYWPVGLAFTRVNGASPAAVRWETGNGLAAALPFTVLGLEGGVLKVSDTIAARSEDPKMAKLYKFTLVIQRLSDGAIGLIDPFLENEN